jgi:plastocyanin
MRNLVLSFGIILVMLFGFGCIDPFWDQVPAEEPQIEPPKEVTPATPSFVVVGPDEGEVVQSEKDYAPVEIVLSTSDLIIKPAGSTIQKIGEGHFTISVDDQEPISVYSKSYTLEGVEPGKHTLTIKLVHNDGADYSPPIVKTVSFYVEKVSTEYVGKDYTVVINDFEYDPKTITVTKGDRITWKNEGAYPRSATATNVFDTDVIAPGASVTLSMNITGTHEYFSLTYYAMKGVVIVHEQD